MHVRDKNAYPTEIDKAKILYEMEKKSMFLELTMCAGALKVCCM